MKRILWLVVAVAAVVVVVMLVRGGSSTSTVLVGPIELLLEKKNGECRLSAASKDREDVVLLGQPITWRITNGTNPDDACGPTGAIVEIHDFKYWLGLFKGDPVTGPLTGTLAGPGLPVIITGTVVTDPGAKHKYKYKVRVGTNDDLDPELEVNE